MTERIVPPEIVRTTISLAEMKFIFQQAKDMLDDLISDADKLYQRSMVIVTIVITGLTGIAGYLVTHLELNFLNVILCTILIIFLWIGFTLKSNITPEDYWPPGADPKAYLLNENYFKDLEENKTPEWYMLYSEVISYQVRISENLEHNEKRADSIKNAITWLFWIPPITLIIIILATILKII